MQSKNQDQSSDASGSSCLRSEQVTDGGLSPNVPEEVPVQSKNQDQSSDATGSSCLRSAGTSKTVKTVPVRRTDLRMGDQTTRTESTAEVPRCPPITCLRSPTIPGSIPTPVHSLTSHQPPKTRLNESSIPCSSAEVRIPVRFRMA